MENGPCERIFHEPGPYVLRAVASDGSLFTYAERRRDRHALIERASLHTLAPYLGVHPLTSQPAGSNLPKQRL